MSVMSSAKSQHYTMKLEGVEKSILSFMNQERKCEGANSCEVLLLANNTKHYAHKIVLTRFSDFFRKYFYENPTVNQDKNGRNISNDECDSYESSKKANGAPLSTIHLPGINSVELEPILEYMYTSTLELKAENVNEILLVACLLQVTSVIEFCAEVLYKQPNWRSPLVSPRILNFVRQDNTSPKDGDSLSPTTVTWAANITKPSSHETRSRRRGKTVTNGLPTKHETLRSEIQRQRTVVGSEYNEDPHSLKKRSLPNSSSQRGSLAGLNTAVKSRHGLNTVEKRSFVYSPTIDYDVLDRNMPLIQAGKMRSIFQREESKPLINHQLSSHERKLPTGKLNYSWDLHSRSISTKRPVPIYVSKQTDRDTFRRHPSRASEDFQATMIPQLIDCRRFWQASTLGLPVYPSSYVNFRLAQGPETQSKATINGECQRSNDLVAINSNQTHPHRQYNACAPTMLRQSQSRSVIVPESHLNTNHSEKYKTHGLYNNGILSTRLLKRDSSDSTDSGMQDAPMNLSQSGRKSIANMTGKFRRCESSTLRNKTTVAPPGGRRDFTNCQYSCFTKPTKSNEDGSQGISGQSNGGSVDYHQRKRKLLRGAQDHDVITSWPAKSKSEDQSNTLRAKSRKQHCSSEDGIIAKDYNKHRLEAASDSDSDDSGRPCSV